MLVWTERLCGIRLTVSLHVWYQVTASVCGEEQDLSFSLFHCQTSKPALTYLLLLDHPDLFRDTTMKRGRSVLLALKNLK